MKSISLHNEKKITGTDSRSREPGDNSVKTAKNDPKQGGAVQEPAGKRSAYYGSRNSADVTYPVMEHFHTIQGEGAHSGKAAWFIRLGGCDVGCWWCDVKESWDASAHPQISTGNLVRAAVDSKAGFVVITGGEPLLHDLEPLTDGLHAAGLPVHIETSGSSPLSGNFDWITLSPKRFKEPLEEIYPLVDELKVVVLNRKDLQYAEENARKCPDSSIKLLQPEWDTPESIPLIVDYVKKNPGWQISLQIHKYLNVP